MTSKALVKRSADSALMPPPPKPKRIKRPSQVLDEDAYTEGLSHIIARDYFPGLAEIESQREYLDALDSRDAGWIASAGQALHATMTPRRSPRTASRLQPNTTPLSGLHASATQTPVGWTGETPRSTVVASDGAESRPHVDVDLSLGAFQAKYTSEDNESFYKLLDKQNVKRADRHRWLWAGNKIPAARQIAYRQRQAAKLQADEHQLLESDTSTYRPVESESRPAMPDTWASNAANNFMFNPDSIEDDLDTVQHDREKASRAAPKNIVLENIRVPSTLPEDSSFPSPSLSAVQDAVTGRPRLAESEGGYAGSETPRVNGFTFVDSEPDADAPEDAGSAWPKIDLGKGDATPNPFSLQGASKRETLHHRLVEKSARSKRAPALAEKSRTMTPKFMSSPRVNSAGLTPAGQKLLGRVGTRQADGNVWTAERTPRSRHGPSNLGVVTPRRPRSKVKADS